MNNVIKNERTQIWQNSHNANDKFALSGCEYDETINFLQLGEFIKKNISVLEIGIGFGYITKTLYDMGVNISALDISKIALNRVKHFCENVYTLDDMSNLPTDHFDVIICRNVIQHIPNEILVDELENIMRSLKNGGVFAVQFVSTKNSNDITGGIGCFFRTPKQLECILSKFGGICDLIVDSNDLNLGVVNGSHVFHVTKK